ncbi:hypothetical protein SPI_04361 [Niveomyces insectorum RCEF 264]|uniref:Uncharacterized protein n=1 Tax=Niveomyces insectorum RCEF 264 TaxID=1081102 RepID=A0A167VNM7_9HYPO|nr:hypothetical protein SPI_04361 [Niveomyces insectorum RCEF 264]
MIGGDQQRRSERIKVVQEAAAARRCRRRRSKNRSGRSRADTRLQTGRPLPTLHAGVRLIGLKRGTAWNPRCPTCASTEHGSRPSADADADDDANADQRPTHPIPPPSSSSPRRVEARLPRASGAEDEYRWRNITRMMLLSHLRRARGSWSAKDQTKAVRQRLVGGEDGPDCPRRTAGCWRSRSGGRQRTGGRTLCGTKIRAA